MRALLTVAVVAALTVAGHAAGQAPPDDPPVEVTGPSSLAAEEDATKRWAYWLAAYAYWVPDDEDYVQPTVTLDRGALHLEARYNYEDLDTASAWVGYTIAGDGTVSVEFTPMLGGVFGGTSGVAPGYRLTLGYRALELYSEGEYVFDTDDSSASFFYNWSELTFAPLEWLWFGLVAQRTRTYQTDRDIQRGLLVGVSAWGAELTFHAFNPGGDDQTFVLAVGFGG